jgi:hypothetical protein
MEPAAPGNRYTPDGDAGVESRIDSDQQLIAAAIRMPYRPRIFVPWC